MTTYTIVEKADSSVVEEGGQPLARLRPGKSNNRWIRPAWTDAIRRDPEAAFAAAQAQADADAADPETDYGAALAAAATAQAAADAALAGDPQAEDPATQDAVAAAQAAHAAAAAASPSLGTCPAHLVGRAILVDVMVEPAPEADQRLGDWPATPTVDLEAGTATWTRAVVDLDAGEIAAKLAAAKVARWAEINAARDAKLAAGCLWAFPGPATGTVTFRSDRELIHNADLQRQADAMVAAGQGASAFPTPYRDNENVNHSVTAQQLADMTAGVKGWYVATWLYASGLKDAVAACETLAAVAAVDIASGWPDRDLT